MIGLLESNTHRTGGFKIFRKIQIVAVVIAFIITTLAFLISSRPHKPPLHGDRGFPPYPQDLPMIVISYPATFFMNMLGIDVYSTVDSRIRLWFLAEITNCSIFFVFGTAVDWLKQQISNKDNL
jgi:hypothetical protein